MKSILIVYACLLLVSCDDRNEAVSNYDYVTNVRNVDGEYIMYEIEDGNVTCREHKSRAELACWNNNYHWFEYDEYK